MNLQRLRLLGFDESKHVPFTKHFTARCSQCMALCINGTPCHETGCRNAMRECNGCNAIIPRNRKYCDDCI